jgi:hypothetical protein
MVLSNYDMSTFMLAYHFADACETQAHTIRQVVDQSLRVAATWNTLGSLIPKIGNTETPIYSVEYFCVFNHRRSDLELMKYPDLAFCALYKQKNMGGSSWANYDIGEAQTTIAIQTLRQKTALALDSRDASATGTDEVVNKYLDDKHRKVPEVQRALFAPNNN